MPSPEELAGAASAAPTGTDPSAPQTPVGVAPAAPQAPIAAQPQQPATPNQDPTAEPSWLKDRLLKAEARATAKLLKDFGFDKPEDVKSRLAKAKELEDAQLSDQERMAKKLEELTREAQAATGVTAVATDAVQELFDLLPEHAKAAIEELQPQSAADRLKLVRAFRKMASGAASSAPATGAAPTGAPAPAAAPPPPPLTAPVTAAPPPTAPRPSGGKTKWDEFQELNKRFPIAAGVFEEAHRKEIEASRPAPS